MASNKVKFGLKNVHYALVTETTTSGVTTTTYGTPVSYPGARSLTVNGAGDSEDSIFRADDSDYYVIAGSNQGFDGSFEAALIPEGFETDVLGAVKDQNGVVVESASDVSKYVAVLFEISGDNSGRRYCVPKVKFSKPSLEAETTGTDGNQPKTSTLNFKAVPRPDDNLAKFHTGDTTTTTVYDNWFSAVYTPTFSG